MTWRGTWRGRYRPFSFGFGFPHFEFYFRGPWWRPPSREEYLRWLEEYREELKAELEEVEREIEELRKT